MTTILSIPYNLVLDKNINHTESIRIKIDERDTGCGIFIDLHKVFCTVEHFILLSRL